MSTVAADGDAWPIRAYSLEIHAVQHCNLRCVGCAQISPHLAPAEEELQSLELALRNLRPLLSCEKVQVLGGEPLLHTKLLDLLRLAVDSGIGKRVVVKTNGLLLHRAPSAFWRLVNEVIVSVYPATEHFLSRNAPLLRSRAAENETTLEFRRFPEFRKIVLERGRDDAEFTSKIYQTCEYKRYCHSLREGRLYRCAPSVNLARQQPDWNVADSVDALDVVTLSERLKDFLLSPMPLRSCANCMGSSGEVFQHHMAPPTRRSSAR